MLTSSSPAVTSKRVAYHLLFWRRLKTNVRTARMEVASASEEAVRIMKIVASLHSAKDLPSVLKLYGVDYSSTSLDLNEMQCLETHVLSRTYMQVASESCGGWLNGQSVAPNVSESKSTEKACANGKQGHVYGDQNRIRHEVMSIDTGASDIN